MPKRSTIKKNPLEDLDKATAKNSATPAEVGSTKPVRPSPSRSRGTVKRLKSAAGGGGRDRGNGALSGRARLANGGCLELLGGSFGTGLTSISAYGTDRRLGFVAPQGERIDLEAAIDVVEAVSDRQEHRLLSAAGWACAAGVFLGPAGLVLGGGLRLLHPRKMVINARFRDGRTIVARTDSVTAAALREFATANTRPIGNEIGPSLA